MVIAIERTKARDLMRTDVACLSPADSIEEAVRILEEYGIGGAPVVDAGGKLVGVLSLRDIARSEHVREGRIEGGRAQASAEPPLEAFSSDLDLDEEPGLVEDYDIAALGRSAVGDWMSSRVVTVGPKTTLRLVCQVMARESIHRVFVVEDGRLAGVISALDVVRFLAEE